MLLCKFSSSGDETVIPSTETLEDRFRQWHPSSKSADVFSFLAMYPGISLEQQLAILLIDQSYSWRSSEGKRIEVESYLLRIPALSSRSDFVLKLIEEEFGYREESGETVAVEDYQQRFPSLKEQLDLRFNRGKIALERENHHVSDSSDGIDESTCLVSHPSKLRRSAHGSDEFKDIIGSEIGSYVVLDLIAKGGMGAVYRARHKQLDRIVAIKVIKSGEFADREQILRFQAEAQAAAKLNHPGIVTIYEVGEHRGLPFMVMEYVDGESLWQRVSKSPLQPRDAAQLMQRAADAVQYAHQKKVIHRDIKPQNILLSNHDQPKVTDFGLAKIQDQDSNVTKTGLPFGTPSYMPPEQAKGMGHQVGAAADIYSLGATLYCLLTGRPPFQAANAWDVVKSVVETNPVVPRALNPAIPLDLETICLKCLQKEPRHRFASAEELAADLGRYLRNEPILARPVSRRERVWRWCVRNPVVASLSATTLGLLIAVAGVSTASSFRLKQLENEMAINQSESASRLVQLASEKAITVSERDQAILVKETSESRLQRLQTDAFLPRAYESLPHARVLGNQLSPGWTWENLKNLIPLANETLEPAERGRRITSAAICLSTVDVESLPLWQIDLRGNDVKFVDNDRIAVTHRHDFLVPQPTIHYLEAATGIEDVKQRLQLPGQYTAIRKNLVELLSVLIADQGKWVISNDSTGRIHRWDRRDEKSEPNVADTGLKYLSLHKSPDETRFLAWNEKSLQVWSIEPFKRISSITKGDAAFDTLIEKCAGADFTASSDGIIVSNVRDELLVLDASDLV